MMKTIVIKLGGSALENLKTQRELSTLVSGFQQKGDLVALVHGGGPAINRALEAKGLSWTFINGQRKTTDEMMGVIEDVLTSELNTLVVDSLRSNGIPALGLSGASDMILSCEPVSEELGRVGAINRVSVHRMQSIMRSGFVPVIAPIGRGSSGESYNINADRAAAKIAAALNADDLIFLTDQEGVLNEKKKLVRKATPANVLNLIANGAISGGMRVKTEAMIEALENGVPSIRVLHAQSSSSIFGRKAVGTILSFPRSDHRNLRKRVYAS